MRPEAEQTGTLGGLHGGFQQVCGGESGQECPERQEGGGSLREEQGWEGRGAGLLAGEGGAALCRWLLDGLSLGAAEARGLRRRKDCLRVPAGFLSTARSVRERGRPPRSRP